MIADSLLSPYLTPLLLASAMAVCEYLALLLAILLDLRAGTRKARLRGEPRTSKGFRRTVTKAASYFITLLSLSLMDVPLMICLLYLRVDMSMSLPVLPLFTSIGSLALICIEGKSIRESADSKQTVDPALRKLIEAASDNAALRRLLDIIKD